MESKEIDGKFDKKLRKGFRYVQSETLRQTRTKQGNTAEAIIKVPTELFAQDKSGKSVRR